MVNKKLIAWIDEEIEYHYQQRESIDPDTNEDALDCYRMHDTALLRLEQIKRIVLGE